MLVIQHPVALQHWPKLKYAQLLTLPQFPMEYLTHILHS